MRYLFLFITTVVGFNLSAQELSTLPPSIKWQQIQSEHFKIIYPKGFEAEANRTTNILENIYEPASRSLGSNPRKFPVLLQNQISQPNGFVTIAPYRSEFFTYSPQSYLSLGNDDWVEHLASHEYRHIAQFQKALTPFTKLNYALFGEYGPGFWATLAAPSWFFEGDAVGLETAMGRTGRGRMPEFTMAFKANLIEKGGFHYYKQHLKSYRDFVPNHYLTGYLMTTHLKNQYGPDIWDKITNNSFRKPFIPFTFSNSIKKFTGKRLVASYDDMLSHQKELFETQLSKFTPSSYEQINPDTRKIFTQYKYPIIVGDKVLAIKSGLSDINQFVLIDDQGNEKTIHVLGIYNDPSYLSANDSIVVWTEYEFDPRWYNRNYSVVKSYNFNTEEVSRLTRQTRYGATAISKDSKYIVAMHQSENSLFEIHLLNLEGEVIKKFENKDNSFYAMPTFDENNNLVLLKHHNEGKQVIIKNISDGSEEIVLYTEDENIGNPVIKGDHLFYNSNYNGIDNIYTFDLKTKEKYLVTQSKFGAFNPCFTSDNIIIYNDFSAEGMNIVSNTLQKDDWLPIAQVEYLGTNFEKVMVENENIQEVLYDTPDSSYASKPFRKIAHIIRPTDWLFTPLLWTNEYSMSLNSQDLVGSTAMSASVTYNQNEDSWRTGATVSYQGLYPIIDVGLDYGYRRLTLKQENEEEQSYLWNENTLSVGLRIPQLLTRSKMRQKFDWASTLQYTRVSNYDVGQIGINQSGNGELIALEHSLSHYYILGRSKLDINPRWGYSASLNLKHTPFGGNYKSTLVSGQGLIYAPGVFKHHSFFIRASYQYQSVENYSFTSPINYTRGYDYESFPKYSNIGLNYTLPIAYMDWHVGPLFNLQRIYANVFYDQAFAANTQNQWKDFNAYGVEVSFNYNMMRYLLEFDTGFRITYAPDKEEFFYEFIIGGITF